MSEATEALGLDLATLSYDVGGVEIADFTWGPEVQMALLAVAIISAFLTSVAANHVFCQTDATKKKYRAILWTTLLLPLYIFGSTVQEKVAECLYLLLHPTIGVANFCGHYAVIIPAVILGSLYGIIAWKSRRRDIECRFPFGFRLVAYASVFSLAFGAIGLWLSDVDNHPLQPSLQTGMPFAFLENLLSNIFFSFLTAYGILLAARAPSVPLCLSIAGFTLGAILVGVLWTTAPSTVAQGIAYNNIHNVYDTIVTHVQGRLINFDRIRVQDKADLLNACNRESLIRCLLFFIAWIAGLLVFRRIIERRRKEKPIT